MAHRKYASTADDTTASILEVRVSEEQIAPEDLTEKKFAKLAAATPEVSPDGYLYVRTRAISSRVNKNNDGWPAEELASAYKTFEGRPVFVDHNNDDPSRTRGVVVWSKLHVEDEKTAAELDPYYAKAADNHKPPTWIELMIEVDAESFPKLANAIVSGDVDAVSMGANIEMSKCSVCDHEAEEPSQYCTHVQMKGATFEVEGANGEKVHKHAYEDCYGVNFFEISFVFDPADETALISDKSPEREAAMATVAALRDAGVPVPDELLAQAEGTLKVASKKEALGPGGHDHQNPERTVNYEPQSEKMRAPSDVDTLRPDVVCKQCGSDMESDAAGQFICPACGWELEPEGLDNPDPELAQNTDLRQDKTEEINPDGEMETELEADKGETDIAAKSPIRPVAPISHVDDEVISAMKFTAATETFETNPEVVEAIVSYLQATGSAVEDEEELVLVLVDDDEFPHAPTVYDAAEAIEAHLAAGDKKVVTEKEPAAVPKVQQKAERVVSDQLKPVETKSKVLYDSATESVEDTMSETTKTSDRETIVRVEEDGSGVKRTEEITKEYGPMGGGDEGGDPNAEAEGEEPKAEGEEEAPAEDAPAEEGAPDASESEDSPESPEGEPEAESTDAADDPLAESEEKVPAMASTESKLMAALKLAKLASSVGVISSDDELAFAGELESSETMEQIEARTKMLEQVKTAGLGKRRAPVVAGRMPSLLHTASATRLAEVDDADDEALFL